jgi:SDR family mycofactocin-dependent oxidoreductase
LAEEGADIVAIDICSDIGSVPYGLGTEEDLDETVALVHQAGRGAVARQADVRNAGNLRSALDAALARFGRVDVVVANAGVAAIDDGISEDHSVEAWNDVIAVNLTGVWNTLRVCSPALQDRGEGGSIIITSSTAGLKGATFGNDAYGAAKHGVVGLMRQYAIKLAKANVRVNCIHPTGVDTEMVTNETMGRYLLESVATSGIDPTNLLPIPILKPRDVSDAVLFLASDLSRYITGISLPVDAGYTAK